MFEHCKAHSNSESGALISQDLENEDELKLQIANPS